MKAAALLVLFAFSVRLAADAPIPPSPLGNTTLLLPADIGNGFAPPRLPSRVRVPFYESVTLLAPDSWSFPIQWQKNGRDIVGATGHALRLPMVTRDDSGVYSIVGAPFPQLATPVKLDVLPNGSLANLSTRTRLAAGDDVAVAGFVVTGSRPKQLLIRAVGPSLRRFGVSDPVAQPSLQILDRDGNPIGFVHIQVVNYWPDLFAQAGAFALDGGETSMEAGPFEPGVYSAHVRDATSAGGTVLIEVYELP